MNISKNKVFNKFFKDCTYIVYLFILSLIPWIEFLNENIAEVDFILNKNFYFVLIMYLFTISFIYFLIRILTNFSRSHIICIAGLSVWILFQHNFIKSELGLILKKINFDNLSSELALFLNVLFIFLAFFFIPKKKILRIFIFIFLILNLILSSYLLILNFSTIKNFKSQNKVSKFNDKKIKLSDKKKPNIYFLILDGMMPLNEFENFYKVNLIDFKKKYNKHNYIYFKDVKNLYGDTTYGLTALFYLESIFVKEGNFDETTNLKTNIVKKFPSVLKKEYESKLISELKNLGYEFKWIGNIFADCSRYNYNFCLQDKKKLTLDYYLISAFLKKTAIPQIFNVIISPDFIQKNLRINEKNNAIGKLQKYLLNNSDQANNKQTFYFVHHMHPHWPYKFDEDCNFKNFPGNLNFEGYKNSYLCVTKQVSNLIDTIEKVDKEAIVIIQSDHSWEMSKVSKEKYGNRLSIFSLIKNNIICESSIPLRSNNLEITNYLLNCLKKNN